MKADYSKVICPNCCNQFTAIPVTAQEELIALRAEVAELRKEKERDDNALNTLAKMFHNAEEFEGEDGLCFVVDAGLWFEGCEAIETLIGPDEELDAAIDAERKEGA